MNLLIKIFTIKNMMLPFIHSKEAQLPHIFVRSNTDLAVPVRSLAGDIVLCS